ncbi:MAG TPA: O-antigen ligase family protein [Bryobacteraceae bacterium]|jgi:endonuclease/exonuclease/phosphatase family metal-dependent hydrolase/O-antigen ligase
MSLADRVSFAAFFGILAAFTLSTLDGGEVAPRIISAVLLAFAALYFGLFRRHLTFSVPAICLLLMTCYGVIQTLWFPQKIVYNGWTGTLFWFTAAVIVLLATQILRSRELAARFRLLFVLFGSAVCLLDLLQQASRTNRFYWLIPSKFPAVFGSFAYWNNFAEFMELVIPVTLWMGLRGRKPDTPFLLLGALQIASVVASGSRAGTALVLAELIGVVLLAYVKSRSRTLLYGAAIAVSLSALFVYAAGSSEVLSKFQRSDQLTVRRNLNKSSLAMIRERPLTGWGLDTYVPVYPMFARYDDGTWVNRAHNDWLQWAAEGGIFFAGLMLVIFFWSIRPALRSGWGLGVIAVCLHALVDYPFARFGVCAWYFAFVAMLSAAPANMAPDLNTPRVLTSFPAASGLKELRVATWNIDRGLHLAALGSELEQNPADVCLFQEVDWNNARSGEKDIASELADRLHLNLAYGIEFEELSQEHGRPAYIGQATLTRVPIRHARILRFQHQSGFWKPHDWIPSGMPLFQRREGGRIALITELEFAGRLLVVYNAHLESRSFGRIQSAQLDEMLADLRQYPPDTAIILGGDLNSKYVPSIYLRKLEQAGFHSATGEKIERTHTIAMALDWIFARGPISVKSGRVRRDMNGSDHYPVYAELIAQ